MIAVVVVCSDIGLTVAICTTVTRTVCRRPMTMMVAPELPLAIANALLEFIGTRSLELGIVGMIATATIVILLLSLSTASTTIVSTTTLLVIVVIVVGTITLIVFFFASLIVSVGIIIVVMIRIMNTAISLHVAQFSALVACSTRKC